MRFKKYIADLENEKSVVFAFGRFNVFTKGHQALWDFVEKQAKRIRGDALIFTSFSKNAKKNPLHPVDKILYMKKVIKKAKVSDDSSLKNAFQIAEKLVNDGYTRIQFIVGADRKNDFDSMKKYVNEWSDGNSVLEIISFSGTSRIGNYSGTRMRTLAKEDNFDEFADDLPKGFTKKEQQEIFKKTKEGLGVE